MTELKIIVATILVALSMLLISHQYSQHNRLKAYDNCLKSVEKIATDQLKQQERSIYSLPNCYQH